MATCLEVITRAHIKLGRARPGGSLNIHVAEIGLEALKSLYLGLVHSGGLGRSNTVYADANYSAQEGDRIFKSVALTVTLPTRYEISETPLKEYGSEADISGASTTYRAPRDGAFVVVTDGATTETRIYDAYSGAWLEIETLTLADPAPLSIDLEAVASALVFDLLDDTEQQPGPSVVMGNRRFRNRVSGGLGSPDTVTQAEYF